MKKDFLGKAKDGLKKAQTSVKVFLPAAGISCMAALPSFASDTPGTGGADVSSILTSSFQTTADSVISTVGTALPIVMQIVGLGICVSLGIRFFKRFAK